MNTTDNMNDLNQLMNELNELDEHADSDSAHHEATFNSFRKALLDGEAGLFDRSPDNLAFDTLEQLTKLLRAGEPSQKILNLVADFLQGILNGTSQSTHLLKQNTTLAFRILGHTTNGPTGKGLEKHRMLEEFETRKSEGADDEAAEQAAYDVYFEREGRTYEKDHLNKADRTTAGENFSTAEMKMDKVIRPMLRSAGLIGKKQTGPRRKA